MPHTLTPLAAAGTEPEPFHPPTLADFFPPIVLFQDPTIGWVDGEEPIFGINRIIIVRLIAALALILIFVLGTRKLRLIPTRGQSLVEMGLGFVRDGIAYDLLGGPPRRPVSLRWSPSAVVVHAGLPPLPVLGAAGRRAPPG